MKEEKKGNSVKILHNILGEDEHEIGTKIWPSFLSDKCKQRQTNPLLKAL